MRGHHAERGAHPRSRRRRRLRALRPLCALLACSLLAACGVRWSGEQRESVAARYEGGGVVASSDEVGRRTATSTTEALASNGGGEDQRSAAGLPEGDAPSAGDDGGGAPPGGAADAAQDGAGGERPCRAPSDAPGVSQDQIVLATIGSQSGPVPGLGASFEAAARAHVAFRNATGGVCGREVVLRTGDDGGDNARARSLVEELDGQALALVMGAAGGGDGAAQAIEARSTPAVGATIGDRLDAAPTFFNIFPLVEGQPEIGKYRYLREQGVQRAALVYIEQAGREAAYQRSLIQAAGIEVVLNRSFPVTTLSYDSLARAVANSDADYLQFIHEAGASASMARSMSGTGHDLRFEEYIVAYGSEFVELAGSAAEGVTAWVFSLPAEDGGSVPAHADFLEWMARAAPSSRLDLFAVQGWASTKVVLDLLEAHDGPISRDGLLGEIRSTGTYDADGMLAPIELGPQRSSGCAVAMTVEGGSWRRLTPSEGFLC